MLCVSLIGPSISDLRSQMHKGKDADILEFRFDLLSISKPKLKELIVSCSYKILFTFKNKEDLLTHLDLNPDFIDLEEPLFREYENLIRTQSPNTKLIVSNHLTTIKEAKLQIKRLLATDADFIKIAIQAKEASNGSEIAQLSSDPRFIPVCMGQKGQWLRALGNSLSLPIVYASSESGCEAAPGQLPIEELAHLYRFYQQSASTQRYALLGDPIDHSIGHIFHNHYFKHKSQDAVYTKLPVSKKELSSFFAKSASYFSGFSVTMPLKREVVSYLDDLDVSAQPTRIVNTIGKIEGKWIGANTDGIGFLHALQYQCDLTDRTALIFGTGSTAEAILSALRPHLSLIVVGRDLHKAQHLAQKYGASCFPIENITPLFKLPGLIFIQATSLGMQQEKLPFDLSFQEDVVICDVVARSTPLLSFAQDHNYQYMTGKQMFVAQAIEQYNFWKQCEQLSEKAHLLEV